MMNCNNPIKPLEWDSLFFNKRIGIINIEKEEDFPFLSYKNYDLVYVLSNNPNLNFKLVDKKIIYLVSDIHSIALPIFLDVDFYNEKKDSYEELLELTLQSGSYSRFQLDKKFTNNEYEKLYTEWINKSISGELATDIVIKKVDNKIVGFATLTKKNEITADIGLVAVHSDYRGQGIAKDIINKIVLVAKTRGFKKIQVVTQLDNNPANELYTKVGFKKDTLTYIYHVWNDDTI